jgi:alpha-galactosidase
MKSPSKFIQALATLALTFMGTQIAAGSTTTNTAAEILTPPTPTTPRINGPTVFGVRPGHPFFYAIPATGERPMQFAADGLPSGLSLDPATGLITGRLVAAGDTTVTLHAVNKLGAAAKRFTIKCGEAICLTPPMGWNSWNCWADSVSQEKVLRSAHAIVSSGLAQHGWSYVNIDDAWQGTRGGEFNAIQGNEKFPGMKQLCDEIHGLGLKIGLYSTPWITSYAGYRGGSSDDPAGAWSRAEDKQANWRHGAHAFVDNDARQWAAWGFDYLKYDWSPLTVAHARAMFQALRGSGRDIVLSLSNSADVGLATEWPKVANCWRTTGDIWDQWQKDGANWNYGVSEIAFSQDAWTAAAGPGHWNDPDMLVVGMVGWGPSLHPARLTADEQYSHITMWCMLSAPLLIGCDLERADAFTLGLLSNDEVLAIDQDALGRQALRVATVGAIDVFLKPLEDGSQAIAFFNRGNVKEAFVFNKFSRIGLGDGVLAARDLWRQQDLPDVKGAFKDELPAHGVRLLKLSKKP